jgi:hypothetical protein
MCQRANSPGIDLGSLASPMQSQTDMTLMYNLSSIWGFYALFHRQESHVGDPILKREGHGLRAHH